MCRLCPDESTRSTSRPTVTAVAPLSSRAGRPCSAFTPSQVLAKSKCFQTISPKAVHPIVIYRQTTNRIYSQWMQGHGVTARRRRLRHRPKVGRAEAHTGTFTHRQRSKVQYKKEMCVRSRRSTDCNSRRPTSTRTSQPNPRNTINSLEGVGFQSSEYRNRTNAGFRLPDKLSIVWPILPHLHAPMRPETIGHGAAVLVLFQYHICTSLCR